MRLYLALLIVIFIPSCDDRLIVDAEDAVRAKLRDPSSAQFYDVERCEKPNAVRGKVNSKNGFGGYDGRVDFFYVNGQVVLNDATPSLKDWGDAMRLCFSDSVLNESDDELANTLGNELR